MLCALCNRNNAHNIPLCAGCRDGQVRGSARLQADSGNMAAWMDAVSTNVLCTRKIYQENICFLGL